MSSVSKPEVTTRSDSVASSENRQQGLQTKVAAWMGDHPVAVISAGVIAGALIGWYLKQKK